MFRKLMSLTLAALLALTAAAFAEDVGNDWYTQVLADEALAAEYPYCALLDVNGDGAPLLALSTTGNAFIGAEDRAVLYAWAGEARQVMAIGGNAGEKLYCNPGEHTLTYYYRYSGEGHLEVYRVNAGALELLTKLDDYAPFHAPEDGDNREHVRLQDGAPIDEAISDALWALYANDADAVIYGDNPAAAPEARPADAAGAENSDEAEAVEPTALEASAAEFLSNLSDTWDSFLNMAGEAGKSVSQWTEGTGVTERVEKAAGDLSAWAEESGLKSWAESAIDDFSAWLENEEH